MISDPFARAVSAPYARMRRNIIVILGFIAFTGYVAFATAATLFFPFAFPLFLAPALFFILGAAPRARAFPRRLVWPLVLTGAALMPFWPNYVNVSIGSLPILTPPRIIFYLLSLIWIYDMVASPWRRGVFLTALLRRRWLAASVLGFFVLCLLSIPLAEGTRFAAQYFFRQIMIWLLPFCICVAYVRRWRDFRTIIVASVIGAAAAGAIAIGEVATNTLVASKLAPIFLSDGEWLRIIELEKSRDGVFRAQSTHTHPISLGEFLGLAAPFAIVLILSGKGWGRAFWALAFCLIVMGALATGSRGALLGVVAGAGVTLGALVLRVLRDPRQYKFRPAIGLASVMLIAASPIMGAVAYKMITGGAGTAASRSSESRIDQIKMGWPSIKKRPVIGYGTGRAAKVVGFVGRTLSLDNYYLSLTVDLGFPGPIIFIAMMVIAINIAMKEAKTGPPSIRWLLIAFAGAMASFAVSRIILSQTGNLNYIYPLIGAFLGASAFSASAPRRARHRRRRAYYSPAMYNVPPARA
ncbi:MAG: O-antigen ligase family protein [Pseudomonadota bacterium]